MLASPGDPSRTLGRRREQSRTSGHGRARLLDVRLWMAFDIDDEGRVLAGNDDLGSLQLVEIAPDGTTTALTDLPSRCAGRYVPGRRQVLVEHDSGGDEKWQISLLDLAGPPGPAGRARRPDAGGAATPTT